ncbi:holo-ACP synthase [Sulfuriferula nivalis]|uniref:Holo-[acyl-carrier-protein] synthase n=1 Tax=Sulfuriferula nivalis TaxID=2675298 RepID=A0A809RK48_9PROT|nr:holo-ACP synthase [Sulfuriferula nivalis]BBP01855.1 holo-[acyl-carrier-protein] synthase [Sulfuriferula nivalis]
MIYGIGTDIVSIPRIAAMLTRHGERAAARLLAVNELKEFAQHQDPARLLAKRFAAKEALSKATGTGLREPVNFANISVIHTKLGQPQFSFAAPLQEWLTAHGIISSHLSITDEMDTVVAFVILERV